MQYWPSNELNPLFQGLSNYEYSHLPTLLSLINMIGGRGWGHPKREEIETQIQEEERQEPV